MKLAYFTSLLVLATSGLLISNALSVEQTYEFGTLKSSVSASASEGACNCCGAGYSLVCECVKSPAPTPTPTPNPSPIPQPPQPSSTLEKEWLDSHNSRRAKYGVPPLEWHAKLAASAAAKATKLAATCVLNHGNPEYGENLAAGKLSPNDVLKMWVENEAARKGGHFTQVLWRMSKYLGCAQAKCASGSYGMVHVCHYVRPGNCNGNDYTTTDSPCEPFEP